MMEIGKILTAFMNKTRDEKYQFLKREYGNLLSSTRDKIPSDVLDLLFAVTYYISINPVLLHGLSYIESLAQAGFKNPQLEELRGAIETAHEIAKEIFTSVEEGL